MAAGCRSTGGCCSTAADAVERDPAGAILWARPWPTREGCRRRRSSRCSLAVVPHQGRVTPRPGTRHRHPRKKYSGKRGLRGRPVAILAKAIRDTNPVRACALLEEGALVRGHPRPGAGGHAAQGRGRARRTKRALALLQAAGVRRWGREGGGFGPLRVVEAAGATPMSTRPCSSTRLLSISNIEALVQVARTTSPPIHRCASCDRAISSTTSSKLRDSASPGAIPGADRPQAVAERPVRRQGRRLQASRAGRRVGQCSRG